MTSADTAHRAEDSLLTVTDLVVEFATQGGTLRAVAGVSFDVSGGQTLGIVGESGCGKSTTGRALLGLSPSRSGSVSFAGEALESASPRRLRELRRSIQMIFQDPVASLNPRRKVAEIVVEGLAIADVPKAERSCVAEEVLAQVGLPIERFGSMLPGALSGGQAQRVAIARALAVRPKLLVCDEPVSSLDVSVQAQILNLLQDLRQQYALTMVFIAHDLGVVRVVCDQVLVMYLGKVCEYGDTDAVYGEPAHPYTRGLLDSVPAAGAELGFAGPALSGDIPSPLNPPSGCRFRTRCPRAQERCAVEEPAVREVTPQHYAACHFPLVGATSPAE
ncbi:ABC transporter ATP-binding protein [Amycolatopsis sp. YIM 10]|uniref:ABC transporter ATP-binding protein n=1 Tax=Amycolatopsis sp. YIM 10 TaxID=2653857 RepID=UPI00129039A9|nr:ABC transporter ATP-binding protein [Amycolatopsis sp. YIM 10]QFU92500.1 Oligopeptide transport ATP-binding protein OppF [Amycolatopsis sp. YIM 10]